MVVSLARQVVLQRLYIANLTLYRHGKLVRFIEAEFDEPFKLQIETGDVVSLRMDGRRVFSGVPAVGTSASVPEVWSHFLRMVYDPKPVGGVWYIQEGTIEFEWAESSQQLSDK